MRYVNRANIITACVVSLLALSMLKRPLQRLARARRAAIGVRLVTRTDRATDVNGLAHSLIATDSATLLIMLDAADANSRLGTRVFPTFAHWAQLQGVASRMLVPNDSLVFAQFARLASGGATILRSTPVWYDHLGITEVPTFLLLDRSGAIRGRWSGQTPKHLEILNLLAKMRG